MRTVKKMLAGILVVLTLIAGLPTQGLEGIFHISAKAADNEYVYGTSNVTRAQWAHNLRIAFGMVMDENVLPDNYFTDIDEETEYYDDILLNIAYGVVDIEAGSEFEPDEAVTREYAAHSMNTLLKFRLEEENFTFTDSANCTYPEDAQIAVNNSLLVLSGGKFMPENNLTVSEAKAIINFIQSTVAAEIVEEGYQNTWELQSGVKEIDVTSQVTIDENDVVSIDDRVTNIAQGDIFVVYENEIAVPYRAELIQVGTNSTTITTSEVDYTDAFVNFDAEGVIGSEELTFESADDDLEIDVALEEEAVVNPSAKGRAVKKVQNIYFKNWEIPLGGTTLRLNGSFKNAKVEYNFKSKTAQAKLVGDLNITASASNSGGISRKVSLFTAKVPGIGGLTASLSLDVSGTVSTTINSRVTVGAYYSKGSGFRTFSEYREKGGSNITGVMSNKIGMSVKFGLTDCPLISGYVYANGGVKMVVSYTDYSDGNQPDKCITTKAWFYADCGTELSCKFVKENLSRSYVIYDVNNSPMRVARHYEDGLEVARCARGENFSYFTRWNSRYGGCGYYGYGSGYGLDGAGIRVPIYEYTLNKEEKATITKYNGNSNVLYIPETIDGYSVVGIGSNVFCGHGALCSVTIPDSVTHISSGTFLKCKNLSYVKLPNSLKRMDAYAFGDCDSLTSIHIPKSLQETDDAYYPEYLGHYYYGAFIASDNLRDITFEEGTTVIANGLFANNNSIKQIAIPDTVTEIKDNAFQWCSKLDTVTFSKNLTRIGHNAFAGTALRIVDIPNSVTDIGNAAFLKCSQLYNVKLPKSLKKMGAYALGDCDSLTSIHIPKSLESTNDAYYGEYLYGYHHGVFIASDNLKTITFEEGITAIPNGLFANNTSIEEIVIPDTVTSIKSQAFQSCANLSSVTLSKNLVTIKSNAFSGTGITKIEMPDTVSHIESGAFLKCKNLSDVKLSKTLRQMDTYAFGDCDSLASIEIPKSLEQVNNAYYPEYLYGYHYGIFIACDNLKTVTFEKGTEKIVRGIFTNNTSVEEVTLPDTVKDIYESAFEKCTSLKTIKLNSGLETIDYRAFSNCTNLGSIEIPDTVNAMNTYVFDNCTALKSAKLPKIRENITEGTFQNCTSLEAIEIPETLIQVRKNAFRGSGIQTIELPKGVQMIGESAFQDSKLSSIKFNDALEKIDSHAFRNCDNLTKAEIPNNVTSFGNCVFYDCDALTDVTLGTGITEIPASTFEHCDSLNKFAASYNVSAIKDKAFKECTQLTTLVIPRKVESIYTSAISYPGNLTIYGISGTYAEDFAKENNIRFVNNEIKATAFTVQEEEFTLNKGSKDYIKIQVVPANFTDLVAYKSTNTDVVTVDNNGMISAVGVGTAKIKVIVGDLSKNISVQVKQPVTSIYLGGGRLELSGLKDYQFTANVSPSNAHNKSLEWTSSDEKVIKVTNTGLVTPVGKGTATLTVEALDGSGVKATCNIDVLNDVYIISDDLKGFESSHNYENGASAIYKYTKVGAKLLEVTFAKETYMEDGFDYLEIYDSDSDLIGEYTGNALAGKTLYIDGDTVIVKLKSDESGNDWGFKVDSVVAGEKPCGALKTLSAKLYGYDDVHVYWGKVKDADGYKVYYKSGSAKSYKFLKKTTAVYYKKSNLSDGIKYTFKVVPYYMNGKKEIVGSSKTVSIYTLKKLSTPTVSRSSSSKVKVTWKNISGESGYQISQSTSKSKTKIVSTYSTTSGKSKTIKATKKKTYYYKVRAYKTVGSKKIYGPWSSVKAYKLK